MSAQQRGDGRYQDPGRDIGIHGRPTLARTLLAAQLVDELRLVVVPSLADSGKPQLTETLRCSASNRSAARSDGRVP